MSRANTALAIEPCGQSAGEKPLAIDLFCGLGGWTDGLLAEGWHVIGFDIERHEYWMPEIDEASDGGKGTKPVERRGWTQGCAVSLGMEGATAKPRTRLVKYPAQLVLQDVLTLHGSQFRDAALIVASPPCQEYSYMAMPWSRAKAIAAEYRSGVRDIKKLTALFDACFRIQREAIEAAGHFIPLVVENVRGACPWVGRSRWNFGSFHLWGDVPALMPMTDKRRMKYPVHCGPRMWSEREVPRLNDGASSIAHRGEGVKVGGLDWNGYKNGDPNYRGQAFNTHAERAIKNSGGSWFNIGSPGQKEVNRNPVHDGVKQAGISGTRANGKGDRWFQDGAATHGSKSPARKAASAAIAKIPMPLARHIARTYHP